MAKKKFDFYLEFGQRMTSFAALSLIAITALILHACSLIPFEAFGAAIAACGAVGVTLQLGRSKEKTAKAKNHNNSNSEQGG